MNESRLSWSYATSLLPLGVYKQCEKSFFDNTALQKTDSSDFFFIKDAEKGLWRFILKQDFKNECPLEVSWPILTGIRYNTSSNTISNAVYMRRAENGLTLKLYP